MYWRGDTEWMACGTGAASYTDKARFSRPKSIKKYYEFLDKIEAA